LPRDARIEKCSAPLAAPLPREFRVKDNRLKALYVRDDSADHLGVDAFRDPKP
jgi:hypothetical protein